MIATQEQPLLDQERIAQIEATKKECELIAKIVAPGQVPIQWKAGEGWYATFDEHGHITSITGDLLDIIEKGHDYAVSVMYHEAKHVWMSQTNRFTREQWDTLGFGIGYNWFEDCRIEQRANETYYRGKELVAEHLRQDIMPGGGLDITRSETGLNDPDSVLTDVKKRLGYIPKHMTFGAVVRQYFYYKEFTQTIATQQDVDDFVDYVRDIAGDEVADAFVKLRPHIEEYYNHTPMATASKYEIDEKAKISSQIYAGPIWDEYQKLVEQSVADQALKELLEEIMRGGQFTIVPMDENGNLGQPMVVDFDALPEELKQEIQDMLDGQTGQQQSSDSGEAGQAGQSGDSGESGESGQPGQAGQSGDSGESGESGQPGQSSTSSGSSTSKSSAESDSSSGSGPVDFGQLSDSAKEQLQHTFDALNPQDQQDLKDKAHEALAETEDSANQQMQGQSNSEQVTRPSQVSKKAQQQAAHKEQQSGDKSADTNSSDITGGEPAGEQPGESGTEAGEQAGQTPSDQDADNQSPSFATTPTAPKHNEPPQITPAPPRQQPMSPEDEWKMKDEIDKVSAHISRANTTFDLAMQEPSIRSAVAMLVAEFEDLFRPNDLPRDQFREDRGELDIDRAINFRGTKRTDIFVERQKREEQKYRFTILVDLSGSMSDKRKEMFIFVTVLSQVFAQLGIDFCVLGFTDFPRGVVRVYKPYDSTDGYGDLLSTADKNSLSRLFDPAEGGSGTPTSNAIYTAFDQVLLARHEEQGSDRQYRNFFIVLTDGEPTDSISGMRPEASAIATVKHVREQAEENDMNLIITGLGIGPGTQFINQIFDHLPVDLRHEIATIFRRKFKDNSITWQQVSSSFVDPMSLIEVLPAIIEHMIKNPDDFKS